MKQIYLRYLVLAETLCQSNIDLSGIDEIGKKLLETIAIKSAQGQPLVVTQTMKLSDIASPATIHRRIEILKKAGLIQVMQTEQNQKIKFLVPTQISINCLKAWHTRRQFFGLVHWTIDCKLRSM